MTSCESDDLETAERIIDQLKQAKRTIHVIMAHYSQTCGIGMQQMLLLNVLAKAGSQLTLGELATRLDLANSTVSEEVERLVRAGLLVRQADSDCRRKVRIELSESGHQLVVERPAHVTTLFGRLLANVPPEEQIQIEQGLSAFNRLLSKMQEEGQQ